MPLKTFPYKWTCLVGFIFLGSILWLNIMLDGTGFLMAIVSTLCLFMSLFVSFVLAAIQKSKSSLYRILINVIVFLLFIPTTHLADVVRERLFLRHLARFQDATNLLIRNGAAKLNDGDCFILTRLPAEYTDLHMADTVLIDSKQKNITVRYVSKDSSAIGHRGYIYLSDDNPDTLNRDFPQFGYKRIAAHWFYYAD